MQRQFILFTPFLRYFYLLLCEFASVKSKTFHLKAIAFLFLFHFFIYLHTTDINYINESVRCSTHHDKLNRKRDLQSPHERLSQLNRAGTAWILWHVLKLTRVFIQLKIIMLCVPNFKYLIRYLDDILY